MAMIQRAMCFSSGTWVDFRYSWFKRRSTDANGRWRRTIEGGKGDQFYEFRLEDTSFREFWPRSEPLAQRLAHIQPPDGYITYHG